MFPRRGVNDLPSRQINDFLLKENRKNWPDLLLATAPVAPELLDDLEVVSNEELEAVKSGLLPTAIHRDSFNITRNSISVCYQNESFSSNESCLFALSFLHNSREDGDEKGSSHFDKILSL